MHFESVLIARAHTISAGTIAGTIDDSFQTNSQLELYSADLGGATGLDMPCVGALVTKDCFHKLAWGCKGIEDQSMPLGLLAGGMQKHATAF